MCGKVHEERHLFNAFPTLSGLKQDIVLPLIFNYALEYASVQEQLGRCGVEWDPQASGLC